jgi:hypothetical protein
MTYHNFLNNIQNNEPLARRHFRVIFVDHVYTFTSSQFANMIDFMTFFMNLNYKIANLSINPQLYLNYINLLFYQIQNFTKIFDHTTLLIEISNFNEANYDDFSLSIYHLEFTPQKYECNFYA